MSITTKEAATITSMSRKISSKRALAVDTADPVEAEAPLPRADCLQTRPTPLLVEAVADREVRVVKTREIEQEIDIVVMPAHVGPRMEEVGDRRVYYSK